MEKEHVDECRRTLLAIESEGGPGDAHDDLIDKAIELRIVKRMSVEPRYTIKANTMRREMLLEFARAGVPTGDPDGKVVDALVCGLRIRGRMVGQVGDLIRLEHWHAGGWETIAVESKTLREVPRTDL